MDFLILICYGNYEDIEKMKKKIKIDGINLSLIRLVSGLVIAFSLLFFGILVDKCSFKILLNLITIIEMIISASLYFIAKYEIILTIAILLLLVCVGGNFAIIPPVYNKIYGISYGPEMYGILGIWIGVAYLIGSLLSKFVLEKDFDYLLAFSIGGGLCFIKIFFLNCCKINKFNIKKQITINNSISEIQKENTDSEEDSGF